MKPQSPVYIAQGKLRFLGAINLESDWQIPGFFYNTTLIVRTSEVVSFGTMVAFSTFSIHIYLVKGGGSAHLIGHGKKVLPRGAFVCGDKAESFRSQVTGSSLLSISAEVAIINILDKFRFFRNSDIVHHNASNPFQTEKQVASAVDLPKGQTFRLSCYFKA